MKIIKSYAKFIESVSGTLAPVNGPGLPRMELRPTLSQSDTTVVFDEPSNKFYTEDEYDEVYREYLEKGGSPLMGGLSKENLDKVLNFKK